MRSWEPAVGRGGCRLIAPVFSISTLFRATVARWTQLLATCGTLQHEGGATRRDHAARRSEMFNDPDDHSEQAPAARGIMWPVIVPLAIVIALWLLAQE